MIRRKPNLRDENVLVFPRPRNDIFGSIPYILLLYAFLIMIAVVIWRLDFKILQSNEPLFLALIIITGFSIIPWVIRGNLNPGPMIIANLSGLYFNILPHKGGYFFIYWGEVSNISIERIHQGGINQYGLCFEFRNEADKRVQGMVMDLIRIQPGKIAILSEDIGIPLEAVKGQLAELRIKTLE